MLRVPTGKVEMVNFASPVLIVGGLLAVASSATPAVPNGVVPLKKVTVPVTVPAPGATAVTVAVKVTAWPGVDVLADVTRVVVVADLVTTCMITSEVLPAKLVSPLYTAEIERPPVARAVVRVALPLLTGAL